LQNANLTGADLYETKGNGVLGLPTGYDLDSNGYIVRY